MPPPPPQLKFLFPMFARGMLDSSTLGNLWLWVHAHLERIGGNAIAIHSGVDTYMFVR